MITQLDIAASHLLSSLLNGAYQGLLLAMVVWIALH